MRVDAADNLLVAGHAVFLEHGRVLRPDHDRLMKILQRKTFRVPVAVFGV
jgi:hypothetical protein